MNKPPRKRKEATSRNPKPAELPVVIDVPAVEVPELTEDEQRDRLNLERKVERAFFEAGKALMELRDRRLYRSTHRTFEEYCRDRFGFERRHPYRLIEAAVVVDNLMQMCPIGTQIENDSSSIGTQNESDSSDEQMRPIGTQTELESSDEQEQSVGTQAEIELSQQQMRPIGTQILPTSERQVRPLTKLEPQQQVEVWQRAVEEANGKVPSARIVTDVVQRIMERTRIPNSYQIGEVCQILVKENPELRGKGGCWGIVTHVGEFSCTVKTWDGELTVGVQHLKSFDYLPQECQQMQQVCDRISRIYSDSLEETVKNLLQSLGKLNRPYLTVVEEKLLSVVEEEYGIIDETPHNSQ